MLNEYNDEHSCVMLVRECAKTIFEYTSGYPYLVSKICKLIDERCGENWTKQGVSDAVKILLREANPLFDDASKKDYGLSGTKSNVVCNFVPWGVISI